MKEIKVEDILVSVMGYGEAMTSLQIAILRQDEQEKIECRKQLHLQLEKIASMIVDFGLQHRQAVRKEKHKQA